MRVLFEISHPSRVHNFKHVIWELEKNGHKVKLAAINKDVTYNLLDAYDFDYEKLGVNIPGSLIKKVPLLVGGVMRYYSIAKKFKPDLFISSYSPISAIVSRLYGKKHLAFHDTENTRLTDHIVRPFTDVICTPECFLKDFGKKQVRFQGYKELCYLHPKYFKPDPNTLTKLGIGIEDSIIFLRLASFTAHHDINQQGITNPLDLISRLEKYGRVILSSEVKNPKLSKYETSFNPEDIHSLLHYSKIYIGDSATMATEAAILGTPSIYISTLMGSLGNLSELEGKYKLVFSYKKDNKAYDKIFEILNDQASKEIWKTRKEAMLREKIDINQLLYDMILSIGKSDNA